MSVIEQRKLLEGLIVDNDNLEKLEDMIAEFNIFETMGAVRQELRHSEFLAFLLNPSEKHGLGDRFLKRFLKRVLQDSDSTISAIEVDVLDLSGAIVERESHHIDILVHDISIGFVCVIENKIYSGEHSNQLARYLKSVRQRFGADIPYLIPIFLSPEGTPPEADNSPYLPVSYSLVHSTIENVRQRNQTSLGASVHMMMEHYTTMLRRHIMTDSDIAELCRKIYAEHKDALDLIFQHRPDERETISQTVAEFVRQDELLKLNFASVSGVQFFPHTWLEIPALQVASREWQSPDLVVRFFLQISTNVRMTLIIGPSDNDQIRRQLFDLLTGQSFSLDGARLGRKWSTVYRKVWIRDMSDIAPEDLSQELADKWREFISGDLIQINKAILEANFE